MSQVEAGSSEAGFGALEALIPGGSASSARRLSQPLVFTRAQGAELWSEDGRNFVDLNCAYGAIVLGRCDPWHEARTAELAQGMDLVGLGTTRHELRDTPAATPRPGRVPQVVPAAAASRIARARSSASRRVRFSASSSAIRASVPSVAAAKA